MLSFPAISRRAPSIREHLSIVQVKVVQSRVNARLGRSGGHTACDLLNSDHDKLGGPERGEADDNVDHATIDVALRGGAAIAFDEISLARGVAMKRALPEQSVHECFDVALQTLP